MDSLATIAVMPGVVEDAVIDKSTTTTANEGPRLTSQFSAAPILGRISHSGRRGRRGRISGRGIEGIGALDEATIAG